MLRSSSYDKNISGFFNPNSKHALGYYKNHASKVFTWYHLVRSQGFPKT